MADSIVPSKPVVEDVLTTTDAEVSAEQPPEEQPTKPFDEIEDPKARTKLRIGAILSSLYLVLFVAALDQTIIATTIPTISASLHSAMGYTWIGSAYSLATAASGPIWSRISDIWGRKLALLCAVALFALASILAAVSTKMQMLIAARALQGTAGGGLGQLVTITISDLFSVRKRSLYMGMLGVMWAVAGSAGPPIGGALTQLASWRWCFWINLPVCGCAFILLLLFLDVHNPRTKFSEGIKAIDWLGTISILAVTLLLLLGLDFGGSTFPWNSPRVICLIAVGGAMILFFLFCEKKLAKYPLMPLTVFKTRSNNAAFIVGFAHNMVSMGVEYYLPLYFQSVKQASPLRSGVLVLPMMLTMAATDMTSGFLIHKTGRYREIMWVGVSMMTLGTGLFILFDVDIPLAKIIGIEIVAGLGPAMLFQVPRIIIQNSVSQAETSSATSTLGFSGGLATSLSLVIGSVVFQNSMGATHSALVSAGLGAEALEALASDKAAANVDIVKTIQDPAMRRAVQEAFAWSMRNMFITYTAIAAVAVFASAFVKHTKLRTKHEETKTGVEHLTERKG
ncbi:MFS drug transporter [Aaosphaeria arxii CBS 175.79]|uniref:MFS drug transporter n=1 Tax=Aaosphaeria arxii CBS 175.79 TaxID=1450172 RepID=A0A6A5XMB4_9PLEO|nr:MFS drug transporter [Aaosphaeria arxii CBS 175.79]KAF2014282.1 MFS drug transporter [Aaosphaeria arxii CBS 175.79]